MHSPLNSSHLYRRVKVMMTPAEMPNTVSATVCVDVKYVMFVRDLRTDHNHARKLLLQ